MKKGICDLSTNFVNHADFLECANCGNHLCRRQSEACRGVCPHCFGRLYPVN